jgi:hypothetical protein
VLPEGIGELEEILSTTSDLEPVTYPYHLANHIGFQGLLWECFFNPIYRLIKFPPPLQFERVRGKTDRDAT